MSAGLLTLTVCFAERQRHGGRLLADALLDLFERRGIATSVLLRGIAGVGPSRVVRTDRSLSSSDDPPVCVTAVDGAARIGALADEVAGIVDRGVIALERGYRPPSAPAGGDVRLSLFVGRRHTIAGRPGYVAACDTLQRNGFRCAEAYLGVDGTTDGRRRRARFLSRNADVPVTVAGVGSATQADAAVNDLRARFPDAWFVLEPTTVCKANGRPVVAPSATGDGFARLVLHTGESTLYGTPPTSPVHRVLVARLSDAGRPGATVLRALWGFRGAEPPHGDRVGALTRRVPVTVTMLDRSSALAEAFAVVDELTGDDAIVTWSALAGAMQRHGDRFDGSLGDDRPSC